MGKRTSDFVAITAILGGVGLGLGLTSLVARSQSDDSSMDLEYQRRSIRVMPGRISDSSRDIDYIRHAIIVEMEGREIRVSPQRPGPRFRMRTRIGADGFDRAQFEKLLYQIEELRRVEQEIKGQDGERVERLKAQVEELRLEAKELSDFEALFEALEELEADLTMDIRQDGEDQRRRRRRRRPHRVADVPESDGSGN